MATLADVLRGYTPPTESALADPIAQHLRNIPQKFAQNQQAQMDLLGKAFPGNTYESMMTQGDPKALAELGMQVPVGAMFIGPESMLWNKENAYKAAKLLKQGVNPEEVWRLTGTGKGLDTQFRQEISDAAMKFNEPEISSFRKSKPFADLAEPWKKEPPFLYDLVEHPELRKAYPASADTYILRGNSNYEGGGSSSPHEWADVTLNVIPARNAAEKAADIADMRSTLLHELQHQVQSAEGFAKGGGVDEFKEIMPPKDVLAKLHKLQAEYEALPGGSPERIAKVNEHRKIADKYTPFGQYQRLAGETEARMTSNRRDLTDAERRANYPFKEGKYGLDVPLDEILIRQFGEPIISRKELIERQVKKLKD